MAPEIENAFLLSRRVFHIISTFLEANNLLEIFSGRSIPIFAEKTVILRN